MCQAFLAPAELTPIANEVLCYQKQGAWEQGGF